MCIRLHRGLLQLLFGFLCLGCGAQITQAGEAETIFQLPLSLTDQQGEAFTLQRYEGAPLVVTMFYGTCKHVCPMLVKTLKQLDDQLTDAEREQLGILMVSLDPERDNPQALQQLAAKFGLPESRWTLAQPQARDVRLIAALLGIKYRQLPNGEFNHTSEMILFDAEGRELGRSNQLGEPAEAFVALVKQALH